MVDSKSEVTSRTDSTEVTNLYDITTQNCIRILEELAKTQPQHIQSISNLQHDYAVAAKNTIENMVSVQKMLANNVNFPLVTPQYADVVCSLIPLRES
jgi:hydroxymethylglutaryl-CoA reductase